jgi:outer membrane receptor protein involved in Fe transport
MFACLTHGRRYFAVLAASLFLVGSAFAQSTGSIQGSVFDATGAGVPNASVNVRNQATGEEHATSTDAAGNYLVPSLPVGTYRIEVKSSGMQTMAATAVELSVGSTLKQDFTLKVASTNETIEVQATGGVVETSAVSVGAVVNQRTVQEIPLNGRHFIDLAYLIPGTVTPPANGFLTAALRGQGSFSFNSAGAREDSVNFMINGINLSDPIQNQITFQPTINTIDEFKVDNSTFGAEYGRNSGSIVNIATRSGANTWHGEAYEFLRNNDLDARNFSNPTNVTSGGVLVPNPQSQFVRNQFGGDGGGAIKKDKLFAYLSYEGLRQRQAVPLSATVLTAAQRTQAGSSSDAIVQKLLPLIPLANSGASSFVGASSAPVNIEQGTANISYLWNASNRLNFYYAIQRDERNEPPSTDGNSFPGEGDKRNGHRQLLTFNEVWTINPSLVNEFRAGGNRLHITFDPDNLDAAPAFGINSGVTAAIGLPHITVTGAFTFGGNAGFPQGRGDNVGTFSDTLSWVHGNHTVRFGGEFRRQNSDNFSYTPGTFGFASITTFLADQANSFSVNTSNTSNRTYGNSLGAFVTDSWRVRPTLTVTLGLRYDWYGTPTEAENRFVIYDPTTNTLQHVGQGGSGPSSAYQQSALNFEPRVGFAWDPFEKGKTVIRGAYAIMTDQPTLGLVTGLAANPPYALPISYSPTAATPFVTLGNAYNFASGFVSPASVAHNYHDAYVSEWNFNIQQQLGRDYGFMVGYFGSKGTDLNIRRNYDQFVNGVRPIVTLSANSPIDPGAALGTINVYESDGNSSYQGLWVTGQKRFSKGLQMNLSYTYSKSIDDNSQNNQGLVIQDSTNIRGDRGLSDFDARNRVVLNGIYNLPFKGNRLKDGWQIAGIGTAQSGNPLNFHATSAALTGSANLRPNVTGSVTTGYIPASNGAASSVGWISNPSAIVNQGTVAGTILAFGNLGRNAIIGPGVADIDFNIVKNTKLNERFSFQIRADAFDLFNHPNFTNPGTTAGSATLGVITGGTRAPAGDFGSSRQLQLAMKLIF